MNIVLSLHSLTLRLVTTRGYAAQWKLALRYALPTGCTMLASRGDPEEREVYLLGCYGDVRDANEMRMGMARKWLGNESDNIRDNQHREKRANGGSAHRTLKAAEEIVRATRDKNTA